MKQLQLREHMIVLIDDLVGEWTNQETMALLKQLEEIGHRDLSHDLESAVNKFVSDMIDRAFVTGYQCGRYPDCLIFKEKQS